MPAFNFQPRFREDIVTGKKRQTIRAKERCKPGEVMQLYTGQRTKFCKKIGEAICEFVEPVEITESSIIIADSEIYSKADELHDLAVTDGFKDFEEMKAFFRGAGPLPYQGFLHCWRNFASEKDVKEA